MVPSSWGRAHVSRFKASHISRVAIRKLDIHIDSKAIEGETSTLFFENKSWTWFNLGRSVRPLDGNERGAMIVRPKLVDNDMENLEDRVMRLRPRRLIKAAIFRYGTPVYAAVVELELPDSMAAEVNKVLGARIDVSFSVLRGAERQKRWEKRRGNGHWLAGHVNLLERSLYGSCKFKLDLIGGLRARD
ncbi:hypothetical protein EV356DRAFT_512211 [Viridothelium virens]|uniref:Uncharacterized protein n=1 Tax=Viridothelium virens TaxID=1048519 RepID=A0A6A6HGG8_VIRVR|nr:hypothetical protein EV356DRAFT_512211 [Viridothelium virens]